MHTQNILQATSLSSSPVRIGFNHGYAFDGDRVRLDAELVIGNPEAAASQEWALQLWACATPFDGAATPATKIAEVPVSPQGWVSADTSAFPPAGDAAHSLVLVLAAGREGRFAQVADYANFPQPELFVQPRLSGNAGFTLGAENVVLEVEGIDNPRSADNLSGSLVLELWAAADGRESIALASAAVGRLAGQSRLAAQAFDTPLLATPAGTWTLRLLLREWTGAGYVTRDQRAFAQPVSWNAAAAPEAAEAAVQSPHEAAAAPEVAAPTAAAPAAEAPAAEVPKPAAKGSKKAAQKAEAQAAAGVSINTASAAELAAVKSLSKTVAAAIVAARPFTSLDELLKVKGMGVKLLDKLKGNLSL